MSEQENLAFEKIIGDVAEDRCRECGYHSVAKLEDVWDRAIAHRDQAVQELLIDCRKTIEWLKRHDSSGSRIRASGLQRAVQKFESRGSK